jgi:hypothetical protein
VGSAPSGNGFLVTLDEDCVAKNHVCFELSHNEVGGTTVTMFDLHGLLDVDGDIFLDEGMIFVTDNYAIKPSDNAYVAITFIEDES